MTIPSYDKCVLLLPMSGSNNGTTFTDYSSSPKTITVAGDAKTVTAQSKYYGSSGYFDGSGDYLIVASDALNLSTNDFTISFWSYCTDQTNTYPNIIGTQGGWSSGSFGVRFDGGQAGKFSVHWNPLGDPLISTGSAYSFNTWRHVELSRSGTSLKMFVDGISDASTTLNSNQTLNLCYGGSCRIGGGTWDGGASSLKEYIQDLAIWNGVALHTSDFTPPDRLMGTISNTNGDPIRDDTSTAAVRRVFAVPRAYATSGVATTSDINGRFSLTVPIIEHNVIIEDDSAGTIYSDIIVSRVMPA